MLCNIHKYVYIIFVCNVINITCVLEVVMCSVELCIGSGNVFSGVVYWEW